MQVLNLLVSLGCLATLVAGSAIVDPELEDRSLFGGLLAKKVNVIVSFNESVQAVIQAVNAMNFSSILEKRQNLTAMQQAQCNRTQQGLADYLTELGAAYESFWINNKMVVCNATQDLIRKIANFTGVMRVEAERETEILDPIPEEGKFGAQDIVQTLQAWGVGRIRADKVWPKYKGQGVVVANIDSGVRGTHEALKATYRSSYGWFDPYAKTDTPNDQNGHGTHTMGTMAGSKGVGVAPGATWIACKGCKSDKCNVRQLYACGQWIQCPTKPDGTGMDCSMAPRVVSNSWGAKSGGDWYDDVVDSWRASGIIPVFAVGNWGSACNTTGSPGGRPNTLGVGSTDIIETSSSFSSLGPGFNGTLKPDVVAPGGYIRSTWHTTDMSYHVVSGTSMACPHVSGTIALMLQKNGNLTYEQVYAGLIKKPVTQLLTLTAKPCGGKPAQVFPNNVFGYGRIDAVNAVDAV